jgi:hypothetical protein
MAHRNFGIIGGKIANPLVVNFVGPARFDHPVDGALDEKIAKMEGV